MLNNLTDEQRDIIYNYNANCELKISYITVDKLMDIIKSLDSELTVWKTIAKDHNCVTPHELEYKLNQNKEHSF